MSFYNSIAVVTNIILILAIIGVVTWFIMQERIRRLDKRLNKNTNLSLLDRQKSLFDIVIGLYTKFRDKLNKVLGKSKMFKDYSLKYRQYIDKNSNRKEPMDYISTKFICGFVLFFLVVVNDVLQHKPIGFLQVLTGFLIGFYIPDLFLIGRRKIIKKQLENDILKAITIMNNSFKSGRSIVQTIEIVSQEIDGPLKEEFLKMKNDLGYGLDLETVFERFSQRVNLEEVNYITTSLTILNKTGGDIVKVFSSIEKTIFNNRKMQEELKNLSASANLLYHVLTIMPVAFVLIIAILDNTYFNPLFNNPLGLTITFIIILIYISYIILVKKIIKIKEY